MLLGIWSISCFFSCNSSVKTWQKKHFLWYINKQVNLHILKLLIMVLFDDSVSKISHFKLMCFVWGHFWDCSQWLKNGVGFLTSTKYILAETLFLAILEHGALFTRQCGLFSILQTLVWFPVVCFSQLLPRERPQFQGQSSFLSSWVHEYIIQLYFGTCFAHQPLIKNSVVSWVWQCHKHHCLNN